MEIVLAQPRGFCAGVVRAVEIVELALGLGAIEAFAGDRRDLPSRHQGAPPGAALRSAGLHARHHRPPRPRRSRRHDGLRGGRAAPRLRLPLAPLYPLAFACEAYARLRGGAEPRLTLDALRMASKPMFFTSEKAQRELGFVARSADRALADAIAWYRGNGYLG